MNLLSEAIYILKNGPQTQLRGAFSGGKDSIAAKRACEIAGLSFDWHYHKTTIDPPEVIRFIREQHSDVIFDRPKHGNFFVRAKKKGVLPSARIRWCCDEYKEARGPLNTSWITGLRREESSSRSSLPIIGLHKRTRRIIISPLANWDSEFLWEFIRSEKLPYPSLYDEGFTRLGCVGCPAANRKNREKEFRRWPRIEKKWIDLARYIYSKKAPWDNFNSFEEYYDAWLSHKF